jgi:hypothetical protein
MKEIEVLIEVNDSKENVLRALPAHVVEPVFIRRASK